MAAPHRSASYRPDAGTARPNRGAARPASGGNAASDAGQPGIAPTTTRTAGALILYSRGFEKRKVDLYNEAYLRSSATLREIDSWNDISAELSQYARIETLVFLVHSRLVETVRGGPAAGELLFQPTPGSNTFRSSKTLAAAATDVGALPYRPRVGVVDLAGCNVGLDLDGVLRFGLSLDATQVIATNHFHEFALTRLQAATPAQQQKLASDVRLARRYIVTPGTDALVEQAKTRPVDKLVLLEWYAANAEDHARVLSLGPEIGSKEREDTFKPPDSALPVQISSPRDLQAMAGDFGRFGGNEPIRRLMRVTIDLEAFRAASDAGVPVPPPAQATPARDLGSTPLPQRPPSGRDAGRRAILDSDAAVRPAGLLSPSTARGPALEPGDQSIVDEVFRRGGAVSDAMGVLFQRSLDRTDLGVPPLGADPLREGIRGAPDDVPGRRPRVRRFTLEDRALLREPELSALQEQRVYEVEQLRPLVTARYAEYTAQKRAEFQSNRLFAESFKPLGDPPQNEPYVSAEEKYLAMQGAYYRAGWTCIKRDVLDLIVPTTFFGAPVIGGVHQEMAAVLAAIELDVRAKRPGLAQQRSAAGFIIGGFVPRLQAGSGVLSNHAFGLAIDIDPDWNPQFKKPEVRKAFARATGYDIGQALYPASSMKEVRTVYERVQKMSDHLKTWLTEWLPKYKEWREQRGAAARERDGKKKVQALDDERKNNLDLNAVAVLVDEYRLEVVEAWLVYGIVTIPPEIIESFLKIGRNNGARWGGQYDNTKDIMHLELLKLVSPDSMARAGRPGRRAPVSGFADLIRGTPPMTPNCARPATPQPRRSAPARPRRR